jgi:thiamine biosynthesis lipoprotein ApbE
VPAAPRLLRHLVSAFALLATAAGAAQPVRMAGHAFDLPSEIEVRDLPRASAEEAIRAAFVALAEARLDLRALEAAAATGQAVALAPPELDLLLRAYGFCLWSEGAVSPLGGEIFRLWGVRAPARVLPLPSDLADAVATASCDRLTLDPAAATLRVAPGSALDFYPFELGWAVDRAVDALRARGAGNLWVSVGGVARAQGPGPDGRGWRVAPPLFPGQEEPIPPFYLRDRALAIRTPGDRPLRIAGELLHPYIDLRRGRPGGGVVAVLVVGEVGVEAAGLGYAMLALGEREGTSLLGGLDPRPSIRWLLGSGEGLPVLVDVNWGAVPKW